MSPTRIVLGSLAVIAVLMFIRPASSRQDSSNRSAEVTIPRLLSGEVYPLNLKAEELDSNWRAVVINDDSTYFTKGVSVASGGETYLVAYEWHRTPREWRESGFFPKFTADTKLYLALVNMRSIQAMTAIQPFNLEQVVKDSNFMFGRGSNGDTTRRERSK